MCRNVWEYEIMLVIKNNNIRLIKTPNPNPTVTLSDPQ